METKKSENKLASKMKKDKDAYPFRKRKNHKKKNIKSKEPKKYISK